MAGFRKLKQEIGLNRTELSSLLSSVRESSGGAPTLLRFSYLWTQGLHNCVDYAFLFVEIVEGGGEVMATCFDLWGWG